jgi:outer membrane cobalamin receptor
MKKRILIVMIAIATTICSKVTFSQEDTTSNKQVDKETVSTKDLSDKTNAQDMADALKSVPGVYIRDGQINIRDASSNKVLILIDGQRMNSAQSGLYDATALPIDAIEKVEVLRGGNSARYGADAVGGVVNFITKKAQKTSKMDLGLRATYGSFNTQYYNIYTSNTINDFNYYVSYKRTQTDGDFKYKEMDGTENTRQNNTNKANDVMVKLGYNNLLPLSSLIFSTQITSTETGTPGTVQGVANYPIITPRANTKLDNMIYNLSYNQQNIFGKADLIANTYYHHFRTRYNDPDSYQASDHNSDQKSNAYGIDLTQNNPVCDLITLTYGYVYRHDNVNSTSIGDKDRDTHSGHATVNVAFKDVNFFFNNISIVPAVRYDAPSDFDKVFSPKVSVALQNSSAYAFTVDGSVSKSYRAPTFNDLYWPEDAYTAGNPNLKPEKGTSVEGGYGITLPWLNKTQIKMNYFYSKLTDQIIWAPRADFKWVPTNVSESQTTGLESYIGTKFLDDKITLEINHTYMDARDKSAGDTKDKLLIYRPYNKVDVNAGLAIDMYSLNLNYQYMSKRFANTSNSAYLGDVRLWSANVGVNPTLLNVKWMLRLDFNNILNENYRLSDGYPMPGREIRVTVGFNLL